MPILPPARSRCGLPLQFTFSLLCSFLRVLSAAHTRVPEKYKLVPPCFSVSFQCPWQGSLEATFVGKGNVCLVSLSIFYFIFSKWKLVARLRGGGLVKRLFFLIDWFIGF